MLKMNCNSTSDITPQELFNSQTSNLSSKVISFSKLKQYLPSRNDFLNEKEYNNVSTNISKNKPLLFLPTYLLETHMQDQKYGQASKNTIFYLN